MSAASLLIYFNQPVIMMLSMMHKTRAVSSDGTDRKRVSSIWIITTRHLRALVPNACGDFALGVPSRSKVLSSQI